MCIFRCVFLVFLINISPKKLHTPGVFIRENMVYEFHQYGSVSKLPFRTLSWFLSSGVARKSCNHMILFLCTIRGQYTSSNIVVYLRKQQQHAQVYCLCVYIQNITPREWFIQSIKDSHMHVDNNLITKRNHVLAWNRVHSRNLVFAHGSVLSIWVYQAYVKNKN